jgi:YVTN family beta-propeller protein
MYVTNSVDGTVTRLRTDTGLPDLTIPVGAGPKGIAWDGGHYMYVCNSTDNTVSVISVALGLVVTTVSVGTTPTRLAWDHSTHIYVCCEGNSTIHRLSTETLTVSSVVACQNAHGVCFDGDAHMWVTDPAAGGIHRISVASGLEVDNVFGAPNLSETTSDHNGTVWFYKDSPTALQKVSVAGWPSYLGQITPTFARLLAWEDSGHMWGLSPLGDLTHYDIAGFSLLGTLACGAHGTALAWDGGKFLYCGISSAEDPEGLVARVNRQTNTIDDLIPVGLGPAGIACDMVAI